MVGCFPRRHFPCRPRGRFAPNDVYQRLANVSISRNLAPPEPNEAVRLEAAARHEALRGLLEALQP
jgi:hypothetical protein